MLHSSDAAFNLQLPLFKSLQQLPVFFLTIKPTPSSFSSKDADWPDHSPTRLKTTQTAAFQDECAGFQT